MDKRHMLILVILVILAISGCINDNDGSGTNANKTLGYFYCAHNVHEGTGESRCAFPADHADYYYCLVISGGKVQKTGAVLFPTGSSWMINKKTPEPGSTVAQGTLGAPVTYQVIR